MERLFYSYLANGGQSSSGSGCIISQLRRWWHFAGEMGSLAGVAATL